MPEKKKRKSGSNSIFDAVDALEWQDSQAARSRKRQRARHSQKSKAAQSQIQLFENLMECRILLQRAMSPGDGGEKEDACRRVLSSLLRARRLLHTGKEEDEDDEENDKKEVDGSVLQADYDEFREEWKEVLNRRHKDLKLQMGLTAAKFKVMDSSFWQTVDSTVSHEQMMNNAKQHMTVFDDSKLYQNMLQDFLAGKQQQQQQEGGLSSLQRRTRNNNSNKAPVDRKASKGRKIRYHVLPKLVNFTFPVQRPTPALDEGEWFQSLFGGARRHTK